VLKTNVSFYEYIHRLVEAVTGVQTPFEILEDPPMDARTASKATVANEEELAEERRAAHQLEQRRTSARRRFDAHIVAQRRLLASPVLLHVLRVGTWQPRLHAYFPAKYRVAMRTVAILAKACVGVNSYRYSCAALCYLPEELLQLVFEMITLAPIYFPWENDVRFVYAK
jgi:hypothetical protein